MDNILIVNSAGEELVRVTSDNKVVYGKYEKDAVTELGAMIYERDKKIAELEAVQAKLAEFCSQPQRTIKEEMGYQCCVPDPIEIIAQARR